MRVELAANESEGVQLVLRYPAVAATYPLRDVRVAVSDLDGPDGNRIESGQVEVLPVGYVNTRPPPYDVEHQGWWPDPLLDFLDGFELDANVWQPVWLDVRTVTGQAPGLYTGTITVTAGSRGRPGRTTPPPRGALRGRGVGFRRSGGAPLSPVPPTGRRRPGVSTSRIAPTWRRC